MSVPDQPPNSKQGQSQHSRVIVGVLVIVILLLILTGKVDEILATLADFTLRHGG